jgi:hypothetical protein
MAKDVMKVLAELVEAVEYWEFDVQERVEEIERARRQYGDAEYSAADVRRAKQKLRQFEKALGVAQALVQRRT